MSDLDDGEDAAEGFVEMEMKKIELLDGILSKCQCCGLDKLCKINYTVNHINLTMGQHWTWANPLVCSDLHCITNSTEGQMSGIQYAWCYMQKSTKNRPIHSLSHNELTLCLSQLNSSFPCNIFLSSYLGGTEVPPSSNAFSDAGLTMTSCLITLLDHVNELAPPEKANERVDGIGACNVERLLFSIE